MNYSTHSLGTKHDDSEFSASPPLLLATLLSAGFWVMIAVVILLLTGCDTQGPGASDESADQTSPFANEAALNASQSEQPPASAMDTQAENGGVAGIVIEMNATQGNEASGQIVLAQASGGGLNIDITLNGLSPGIHGFHVHERGDCSAPDAASAGGHFNPENLPHGGPRDEKQHAGDLGNLEADPLGEARASITTTQLSLDGPNSVAGRAFIVHRDPDNLESQPSGAAGARVACGVVPG